MCVNRGSRSAKDMTIEELVTGFANVSRQAIHIRISKFERNGDIETANKLREAYKIFKNSQYEGTHRKHGMVHGFGTVGVGDFSYTSHTDLYGVWNNLMERCSGNSERKILESYKDVAISEEFRIFQIFAAWAVQQIGYNSDFHLDKDLLSGTDKIYSRETCVYLPREINVIISNGRWEEGKESDLPTGVRKHHISERFIARCHIDKKLKHLGMFDTAEEASKAYKIAKKCEIVKLAEKWKSQIDPRAYEALLAFEV